MPASGWRAGGFGGMEQGFSFVTCEVSQSLGLRGLGGSHQGTKGETLKRDLWGVLRGFMRPYKGYIRVI